MILYFKLVKKKILNYLFKLKDKKKYYFLDNKFLY